MYELISHLESSDKNREVKIFKMEDSKYLLHYFKLTGNHGDLGYKEPDINIMPEQMYVSSKMAYDLQFETRMLPCGIIMSFSLEEAELEAQKFMENAPTDS